MIEFKKDDLRNEILASDGNLLIMGGPGSGKTTIALFKAKELTADSNTIRKSQKILFLSFARATISRVEEQAGELIPQELKKQIEINTYHGFIWNIIKHQRIFAQFTATPSVTASRIWTPFIGAK